MKFIFNFIFLILILGVSSSPVIFADTIDIHFDTCNENTLPGLSWDAAKNTCLVSGTTVPVNTTLNIGEGVTLQIVSAGNLNNYGIINTLAATGIGINGTIINVGTFTNNLNGLVSNSGIFINHVFFINHGNVTNNSGGGLNSATFTNFINADITNTGIITNGRNAVIQNNFGSPISENDPGATFHNDEGSITNNGLFTNLIGGNIYNNATLTNAALFYISSGIPAIFDNYGNLVNTSGNIVNANINSIINNFAIITNNNSSTFGNSGIITNNGLFTNSGDGTNSEIFNNVGSVINNVSGDAVITTPGIPAINNISQGVIYNAGTIINNAGTNINNAGTINNSNNYSGLDPASKGVINNEGTITNFSPIPGTAITTPGAIHNVYGTINNGYDNYQQPSKAMMYNENDALITNEYGSIVNDYGATINNSGAITNTNSFTNYNGTITNNHSGNISNSGVLTNGDSAKEATINNGGAISNSGTINNETDLTFLASPVSISNGSADGLSFGSITNSGIIYVAGSTAVITNPVGSMVTNYGDGTGSCITNKNCGVVSVDQQSLFDSTGAAFQNGDAHIYQCNKGQFKGTVESGGNFPQGCQNPEDDVLSDETFTEITLDDSVSSIYQEWLNHDGKTVYIFPESVEKLKERGYLTKKV